MLRIFFHHFAGYHDLVSASQTFQAEICSHTKDLPLLTAAGMAFFQCYDISYFIDKIHVSLSLRTTVLLYIDYPAALYIQNCFIQKPLFEKIPARWVPGSADLHNGRVVSVIY